MAASNSMNLLAALPNVLNAITGTSATSTSSVSPKTTTQQTQLSTDAENRLIQQMLSAPGGVKDISGAARGAGLYNSSTEALLTNDLQTRVAGDVAVRSAPTTTTTTGGATITTARTPGMNPMLLAALGLGGLASTDTGAALLNPLGQAAGQAGAASGVLSTVPGDPIGTLIANNSQLIPQSVAEGAANYAGTLTPAGSAGSVTATGVNAVSNPVTSGAAVQAAADAGGGADLAASLSGESGFADAGAGAQIASSLSADAGSISGAGINLADQGAALGSFEGLSAAGSGAADLGSVTGAATSGLDLSGSLVPGVGSFIGGLMGGGDISPEGLGMAAVGGLAAGGPIGMGVAVVGSLLGSLVGSNSVVCTALQRKGLLSTELYMKGQAYLATLSADTIRGYYFWGKPLAAKIDAGSKFWTYFALPWAYQRTYILSRPAKWYDCIRYPLGTLTKNVGEPLCTLLGKFLNRFFPEKVNG